MDVILFCCLHLVLINIRVINDVTCAAKCEQIIAGVYYWCSVRAKNDYSCGAAGLLVFHIYAHSQGVDYVLQSCF